MTPLLVIGVIALVIGVYVISTYNQLVTLKARIKASIQEIGNQLKRQADLIPNLQESAKAFLKQEKGIFKMLTDARKAVEAASKSGDMAEVDLANDLLGKALGKIQVLVESNPEIKSDSVVTQLMNELRDTSDKVMYARRTLIDLAADYNIMIATFPSNFVAKMFGFAEEKGLEMADATAATSVSTDEMKTPKVNLDTE